MDKNVVLEQIKKVKINGRSAAAVCNDISVAVMRNVEIKRPDPTERKAFYFSMEFLTGRAFYNNLLALGLLDETSEILKKKNADISMFENLDDPALGNGGLGRLAACFLDSAASLNLPLYGYGIRYKYGLFRQKFENGFQIEYPDDWQKQGDAWGVRDDADKRIIHFSDLDVDAVPYDYPVIGYCGARINTLRLWQAEAMLPSHNRKAKKISEYLYPDDSSKSGKLLRIRQEYFFSAASVGDMLDKHIKAHGADYDKFVELNAVQLNDTHPVFAIAEFLRLLTKKYGVSFQNAVALSRGLFNYTNHTIMAEALEKWDASLMKSVLPEIYEMLTRLDEAAVNEFKLKKCSASEIKAMRIRDGRKFNMANTAVYVSGKINGVAEIHTEILKKETLKTAYKFYPEKFRNKTNGITQRRWLMLANPELSRFIDQKIGVGWRTDFSEFDKLKSISPDCAEATRLAEIKRDNKIRLAEYIKKNDGLTINPDSAFFIQTKRLHEYKRQLMCALGILEIYNGLKSGNIKNFAPATFIFGAKAAPGYKRAKSIIKLINEISKFVDSDKSINELLNVVFVENYNVSYAEKLVAAADVSLQLSTAGTEASGTGNMKFMLNGAVTLGTEDGANIEIFEAAGKNNNYPFGANIEQIDKIKGSYQPLKILENDADAAGALNYLIDGTLNDGGTGAFKDLYDSLTIKTYNDADAYFTLLDLPAFVNTVLKADADYRNTAEFQKKAFINISSAGKFSSDRTVKQYAADIWRIVPERGE